MTFAEIAIIICLVCFLLLFVDFETFDEVQSSVDRKYYKVKDAPNQEEASNIIAILNARVIEMMRHLKSLPPSPMINNLLKRFNPDVVVEHIPRYWNRDTSYTIMKGKSLHMCIRDASGEFHDINTLTFVMLHEISHIASDALNHPDSFWYAFRFILNEAVKIGIYDPIDYRSAPIRYCKNIDIDYSPLYDETL